MDVLTPSKRWVLDEVAFTIDAALGVSVRGDVARAEGSYETGPSGARLEFTVDVTSVETGNGLVDGLLRSADSQVRFRSTDIRELGGGRLSIDGLFDAGGAVQRVDFDAVAIQVVDGLRLEAAVTVDRQLLGSGAERFAMFLPATTHVTLHFQ